MHKNIATVLFDADGVLIRSDMASRYFEEQYGIDRRMTVEFYKGPFTDCLSGVKDMHDVLPAYLKQWGWQKSPEDFVQEWFDFENKVDAELVAYVQTLRRRGIKAYVATNQEKNRAQYMLEQMGFANSFDGLFASAHLGAIKPDIIFFERLLDELTITDKRSVLFWDDSEANIVAAQQCGISAELYTNLPAFRSTMRQVYGLR